MALTPDKKWRSPAKKRPAGPAKGRDNTVSKAGKSSGKPKAVSTAAITTGLPVKKKVKMPEDLAPMLATLVDKPFDDPDWMYEVKWDGYRALAYTSKGKAELRSRNNKNFNDTYYPIYDALKKLPVSVVIDGEIAVLNEKGMADFGSLQQWRSEADGELVYYVFDILWLDGFDLMPLPLSERRKILEQILPAEGAVRLSEVFKASGAEFFEMANKLGMEGIIAKKRSGIYRPGTRSKEWLKIKTERHQEAIIGGYTKNENTSKLFSALLLGVYDKGEFVSIGPVGTGFPARLQQELLERLKPLKTKTCPFKEAPDYNKPSRFRPDPPKATVTWVKPEVVVEISYRELTRDGAIRQPSFRGIREDKKPETVVMERAQPTEAVAEVKFLKAPVKGMRKTLLNPADETQVRKVEGHDLKFSNLSKIYWPKEGYTKREMLNYYYQVAPYILPYLKDRPQSLNRYPNGITGYSFYQKDLTAQAPDWMKLFPYHTSDGEDKNFMVPTDEAGLLYMANLGAIEMNPWNSTIHRPEHPDWCLIDLDPTDKNSFEQVIETALVTRQVLNDLGVPGYPKTSGSTGIHIYIPLGAKYTYDECQLFGKLIATRVHEQLAAFTSIERMTRNRKGKIYIDYLQNRPKATLAAPYSLRPKPGAPVSMPLHWEEVKKGLKIKDFTITNAMDRIKKEGDIFKPVLGKGINMAKVLKAIGA